MKYIYNCFIPLLPILSIYKSPISGLDLGTMIGIIMFFIAFLHIYRMRISIKFSSPILFFLVYIMLVTIVNLLLFNTMADYELVFFRSFKFVFLIFGVCLLIFSGILDAQKIIHMYISISVLASIYIILQALMYYGFSISLPNVWYGYISSSTHTLVDFTDMLYRPSAFFLEPAHYFQYVVVALVYLLFGEKVNILSSRNLIIILLGIIVSTSGQGYVISLALLILYGVINGLLKLKTILVFTSILMLIFVGIGEFIDTHIDFIEHAVGRFISKDEGLGEAWFARVEAYALLGESGMFSTIFGHGVGNVLPSVYYAGIPYMINCVGICGTTLFILYFIKLGSQKGLTANILVLVYIFTLCIAQGFNAVTICVYLSLLLTNNTDRASINC